jgi:two-component system response regulator DesR
VTVGRSFDGYLSDLPDRPMLPRTAPLSPREIEVARCLSYDLTTKMVAETLGISIHTVKQHVRAITRKTAAKTRLGAVCKLIRQGVI